MTNEAVAILTVPIVLSIIIGLTTQLVDIAESASDKVAHYADDMENALDCAFVGIPIDVCSPGLSQTNFKEDLKKLNATNAELIKLYEKHQDQIDTLEG